MGAIRTARRGISLIEVLISIGVLALGLLGVAALFPVGSYYMLQAEIKDRSAAVAQQAFADLTGKGMLNPEAWMADDGSGSFMQPFARYCREQYQNADPAERNQRVSHRCGHVVVIDPLAISTAYDKLFRLGPDPNPDWQPHLLTRFPMHNQARYTSQMWLHFSPTGVGSSARQLPIRRVTLPENFKSMPMRPLTAERLFVSLDDAATTLPDDTSKPGQVLLENGGLARDYQGDYSWLATIAPTTTEARNAMFNKPSAYLYDVSVVVFFKRVIGGIAEIGENEVTVSARVVSTGTNGGQLILSTAPSNPNNPISRASRPYSNLKAGQYVMLTGPHPESTSQEPRLFFQWYRVVSIDTKNFDGTDLPEHQRLVALRGPDWPWRPSGVANNIANDLRVGIFPGAVAVHTKTMRLGGGGGGGGGAGSPWAASGPDPPGYPPTNLRPPETL